MDTTLLHIHDERPWGSFNQFTHGAPSTVKLITVKAHQAFSLQTHEKRNEFWRIISGNPLVTTGTETKEAKPGDEFLILEKTPHRVEAQDNEVVFLEISFGEFDEKDIVRLEDRYGRK